MKETVHTQDVYQMCVNIINQFDSWTDIFKGLIHEVFKDYGILLIDAQYPELRQMEKPLFKEILEKRIKSINLFVKLRYEQLNNNFHQ